MNNQLTPEQSINILSQVAAQFRGTRQEHELLDAALRTINSIIPKTSDVKSE